LSAATQHNPTFRLRRHFLMSICLVTTPTPPIVDLGAIFLD